MPFKFNRILIVVLALGLVLAGLAGPGWAKDRDEQNINAQFIITYAFPDKTGLELMQLGKDFAEHKKIEARLKAGEKVEYGQLAVTSQPEGAGVLVSSYIPLGKTPYTNEKLLPGQHRVTVRKKGFYEQVRMVGIKANQQVSLDFKLKPIPYARLTVKVRPPTTKVKIVDVEEPYTPGMKLAPGRYIVSLSHPMYGEQRLCAVLKDNQELTLKGDLATLFGTIEVESAPSDATVYLDGREAGRTPFKTELILLPPGPHLVQVWKSLFKPVSVLAQVKSLKTTTVKVDLPPAEHFSNSVGMEFVKIPAGKFMMGFNGSPEFLAERIIDIQGNYRNMGIDIYHGYFKEFPQHMVEITKPFFMQTTEVTNAQWDKVMGTVSRYKNDESQWPVNGVSIKKAEKFITRLNQLAKGKYRYRLPTEAEWEYAARAGTKGLFYTGDYITTDQANFRGKPDFTTGWIFGKTRGHVIAVKSFSPNPWGLYDMYGNVMELCSDWFDGFYYTNSPIKDPKREGGKQGYYVGRGGCRLTRWIKSMSGAREYILYDDWSSGLHLVAEKLNQKR